MTSETDAEFVERISREIYPGFDGWRTVSMFDTSLARLFALARRGAAADAAIAIIRAETLEEAAKVVTEHYQELCAEHRLLLVNRAAAIRALKDKP